MAEVGAGDVSIGRAAGAVWAATRRAKNACAALQGTSLAGIHIDACRVRWRRVPMAMTSSGVRRIDGVDPRIQTFITRC